MKRRIVLALVLLLISILFTACSNNIKYELVIVVKGQGTVVPADGVFKAGSIVTFSVEPEKDWVFGYWQGSNCHEVVKKDEKWLLYIDGDKEITAVFKEKQCSLHINIQGEGKVEEQLISDTDYSYGALVELKAVPASGWSFKEWQGAVAGREPLIQVVIDENVEITAVFEEKTHNLTIFTSGEGTVKKKTLRTSENTSYPYKTIVELSAIPAEGWEFSEWLGDFTSSESIIEIVLDGDKELRAVFINDDSQESYLYGRLNITHRWPNPYFANDTTIPKPGKEIARLPVIDYSLARLNPQNKEKFVPGEIIIGFKKGLLCAEDEQTILANLGLTVAKSLEPLHAYLVKTPANLDEMGIYQEIDRLKEH